MVESTPNSLRESVSELVSERTVYRLAKSEIHERNPYVDPTKAGTVSGVAPATVVTAGFDPLRDGAKAYAEQLVHDGVPTRYENYEAMLHGFMTFREIDRAHDAIVDIAGDLADVLAVHRPQ